PFFGLRGHVHSPREALMLLGLNVAAKAVAGIVMRRAFPRSPQLERFWDASALIAKLSGWLAQRVTNHRLRADDAYTFGLFRDCGIPILLARRPSYFEILVEANHDAGRSFTAIEDLILPTNHAVVGSILTQSWGLTNETTLSVQHHHDLAFLDASTIPPSLNSRYMIAVAQLAEYLLQRHTGRSHTREWDKLGPACLRLLKLDEAGIADLLTEAMPIMDAEL
ncbi:MAG: HDOD domain-containing protein, partial [Gallionella sp.]|nr:HDOD domain-containing protein [Gallionella sp.]